MLRDVQVMFTTAGSEPQVLEHVSQNEARLVMQPKVTIESPNHHYHNFTSGWVISIPRSPFHKAKSEVLHQSYQQRQTYLSFYYRPSTFYGSGCDSWALV